MIGLLFLAINRPFCFIDSKIINSTVRLNVFRATIDFAAAIQKQKVSSSHEAFSAEWHLMGSTAVARSYAATFSINEVSLDLQKLLG